MNFSKNIHSILLSLILMLITFNIQALKTYKFENIDEIYSQNSHQSIEFILMTSQGYVSAQNLGFLSEASLYVDMGTHKDFFFIEKTYDYLTMNNINTNLPNAENEVFAYELDKALGLNIVAPTIYFQSPINKENYHVRQVFIQRAHTQDSRRNKNNFKLNGSPIIIFDKLIGATDRNDNNYLVAQNGTTIAIDHEFLFGNGGYILPQGGHQYMNTIGSLFDDENEMKAFFYKEEIYEAMTNIDWEQWTNEHFPKSAPNYEKSKQTFLINIAFLVGSISNFVENNDNFFNEAKENRAFFLNNNVEKIRFIESRK
ncbi:hypothetical protein [Silvanigrella aquatica]|uniref:Uncharacterized protein n=1 Tax=Silvanigrella aquatica TaxID=1915309 RepID=A0A1L4CZ59_9BACT|nr:hypothetical protein [Silvanigrella aquatica]APJ03220.1 hypothetical protein AXG55_04600 [Silvanigrella aquatica]